MKIHILTIFPDIFFCVQKEGILKIAEEKGALNLFVHNLRDFTKDKHKTTDDTPYGGGAGMVMTTKPVLSGISHIEDKFGKTFKILLTPQGERFNQRVAHFLSEKNQLLFLPAHYEGIDERVLNSVDMELSVGDFILSGGEFASLLVIDAIVRLLPGVLGNETSLNEESFENDLLEYPHYTHPREVNGENVPEVLLSGHHENIRKWRLKESIKRTLVKRTDILLKHNFTDEERNLLKEVLREINDASGEILK